MKKNIKKIIPAIIVTSMLATTAVFASNVSENSVIINPVSTEIKVEQVSNKETEQKDVVKQEKITFNLIQEGENLLLPVRDVFETLGFEIKYEAGPKIITLTKGAQYVTFSTTEDAYTFARMAPQKLGQAPIVKDGNTYVPVTLLTDIMQMEGVTVEGTTLTITTETTENVETTIESNLPKIEQIIIKEVNKENNTITVEDPKKGEVVLNTKDLKIEFTTDLKQLSVGQAVEVEYGDIMTASLPPMNTPKSLKVVQKYNAVEVLEVSDTDEKGYTRILVKDEQMGEVVLIVSKETKMDNIKDLKDIKKGDILKVAMSDAMTMSLPPQTAAKELSIMSLDKEEGAQTIKEEKDLEVSKVEIVSVDKENSRIVVKDEKLGEVILNISDDVEIVYDGAKEGTAHAWNWMKEGQKLGVVYSPIMTKSLPPINNPIKITVLK